MIAGARMLALLLLVIAFIFLLAATSTRGWKEERMKVVLGQTIWYGLFEKCEETYYVEKCGISYDDPPGWLYAARTTMITATILCGIAMISSIMQFLFREDQTKIKLWGAGVLMLIAGIAAAIGLIIYTAQGKPNVWELPHVEKQYKWSFSYAFGWAGAIISIFTFIFCLVADTI